MDFPNSQSRLLPTPGEGYQLIHHEALPYSDGASFITHNIGVYVNFAQARVAAEDLIERTLNDYLRRGYYGRYYDEIDLDLRGLITRYVDTVLDGYDLKREFPISEFLIQFVEVWDHIWEAEARPVEEEPLFGIKPSGFSNMQGTNTGAKRPDPILVVRLPVPVDRNPPSTEQRTAVFPRVLLRTEPRPVDESTERPPSPRPHFAKESEVTWQVLAVRTTCEAYTDFVPSP
jgi:hypothetical protein